MSIVQFTKLLETVGIPVLTAGVAAYALWFILKWLLVKFSNDFEAQLRDMASEIDEELRDTRTQIVETKTILIRLVDRVRLLDQSLLEHDAVARTIWGINPKTQRKRTRAERRDELQEELRNIGKNGDH
tara:strand:+ start:1142 stop:1528 length:387 start_codon:yes stop_codon:yes gene_type:complete